MIYILIAIAVVFGADLLIHTLSNLKQRFNKKEDY